MLRSLGSRFAVGKPNSDAITFSRIGPSASSRKYDCSVGPRPRRSICSSSQARFKCSERNVPFLQVLGRRGGRIAAAATPAEVFPGIARQSWAIPILQHSIAMLEADAVIRRPVLQRNKTRTAAAASSDLATAEAGSIRQSLRSSNVKSAIGMPCGLPRAPRMNTACLSEPR